METMIWQRVHSNSFVSLNVLCPICHRIKEKSEDSLPQTITLVGFRVWENQRNFFFTGVVSIVFSESTMT